MSTDNPNQKIALVTGATRGIGAAIAQHLRSLGYTVIGTATSSVGVEQIQAAGLHARELNVTNAEQTSQVIEAIIKEYGGLGVLVNNAGITRDNLTMRMKNDEWDSVIDTNLSAVFRLSRAVMRPMLKQRYGRIINITSVVGASGNPGQANYCAAKAGVVGLTRSLARELANRQITVNCVAPGFIATDMTAALTQEQQDAIANNIPAGSMGTPADIAYAVAFLASPEAGYITGQELHVNGGLYM